MSHSRLAASASSRWLKCPGSIRLIETLKAAKKIPQESRNPSADRGTAVHYMIEQVLDKGKRLSKFRGQRIKVDNMTSVVVIDSDDIAGARVCIQYVRKRAEELRTEKVFSERKYDLSRIYQTEIGGTSDITIIGRRRQLDIGDYKNGKWNVEVLNNSQLRIYGLGAYYALRNKHKIKNVRLTIIQPNSNHDDGPIRSEDLTIEELLKWERLVLVPVLENLKKGKEELVPDENNQCLWCEAKGHCLARKKQKPKLVVDVLSHLNPITDVGSLPEPDALEPEELVDVLINADKVIKFYNDCKKYALEQLNEDSSSVDGWGLVPRLGNRKFVDKKKLRKLLKKKDIKIKDITINEDRLMTPTELKAYLKEELDWDNVDAESFIETVTERNQSGVALKELSAAEEDFAEFI